MARIPGGFRDQLRQGGVTVSNGEHSLSRGPLAAQNNQPKPIAEAPSPDETATEARAAIDELMNLLDNDLANEPNDSDEGGNEENEEEEEEDVMETEPTLATNTKSTQEQRNRNGTDADGTTLRMSIRHTRNPFAASSRRTQRFFTPEDATRVNSRYVDRMKPLQPETKKRLLQQKRIKRNALRDGASTKRDNIKPVVIRTPYRQLAVSNEVLEQEATDNDKILLTYLRKTGRIVAQSLWYKYILVNARRYRQCHTAYLSLDIAMLAFMFNIMFDATEFHNGQRRRISASQLQHIIRHIWPLRYMPRLESYPLR